MTADADPLPYRPSVEEPDRETRTLALGTGEAADLCTVLSSDTAATILDRLDEDPATASDLAGVVDTSLQNVTHHLRRLRRAGLVRVVDTWYSSKGAEMKVYATAFDRLVIAPGGDREGAVGEDPAAPTPASD